MVAKLTENTLVRNPDSGELVSLLSGQDLPDWAEGMVGDHLLDAPVAQAQTPALPDMTVDALQALAAEQGIDLAGATKKDDIIARIVAAQAAGSGEE